MTVVTSSTHYERVLYGVVALMAVLAVGTGGYIVIEGWGFLDALYMSVTTITTVGFREVQPLDDKGRIFTMGLVLMGAGTAFYILTAMVAAIIEGDLRQVFGARRMRSAVQRLKEHYIICGYGRVGEEIARELSVRKAAYVVVDLDLETIERARNAGLLVVHGDASEDATLIEAGIEHCRALIAASDSDIANTYITLTARGLRPDAFVVARVSSLAVEPKLRQAGANRIISPYSIGGRRMAMAALQPIMTDFIDMVPEDTKRDDRILAEMAIDETSQLAGQHLSAATAHCGEIVVLALRDAEGRLTVGPPGSTKLAPGDRLVVVGDEDELRAFGADVTDVRR